MRSIRVILADDHDVVRAAVRDILDKYARDIEVIGEAATGEEVLKMKMPADVYVLDISMPRLDGIETTDRLLRRDPETKVVILTIWDEGSMVKRAMEHGARAYVFKLRAGDELPEAIREVHTGGRFLSPCLAEATKPSKRGESGGNGDYARLTPREREVFKLAGKGLSDKDIARKLHLSSNTVHTHRERIMKKLHIHKQTDLVRYALKNGFVDL